MSREYPLPYQGPDNYVFISYSHEDKDAVYEDIEKLKKLGVRIWYDKGIPAGPKWDEFVYPKIANEQCAVVLFYMSKHFFSSEAIAKEIKIVFNTEGTEEKVKESFSVNLGGLSAFSMFRDLNNNDSAIEENTVLILEHFSGKRIFIPRNNDVEHIDSILNSLERYNVIDEKYKFKIKKSDRKYNVLMVGKDSSFTKSIMRGAHEKFSREEDFIFECELTDTHKYSVPEDHMIEEIEKREEMLDGLLIRPIHDLSKKLINKLEDLIKGGKRIILLDKDMNTSQKKAFRYSLPLFLGSNFSQGGKLIGLKIEELIQTKTNDYRVLILDGPKSILSAEQRVTSLKKILQKNNRDINTTIFMIDTFNVDSAKALLENKLRFLYDKDKNELPSIDLFLYLANDNIARSVIKAYKSNSESYIKKYLDRAKSVIFIGYDGIKNDNSDIDLFTYDVNAITIDVLPIVQGSNAADTMMQMLTTNQKNKGEDLTPTLKENINLKPQKGKSITSIDKYLKTKKTIIFDLDGTIANTEVIHYLSYKKLLKELDIQFEMHDFMGYIGNSERVIWKRMKNNYNIELDIEEMVKKRTNIVLTLIEEEDLKPFDYFFKVLEKYPNHEKVILSSQIPLVINYLINKWDLEDVFSSDKILSVSDEKHKKSFVLENLSKFYNCISDGYKNEDIILFEDSNSTLKAARDLGIDAIGIEHQFNYRKIENCNYILNEEISSGLFIGLAGIDIVHYQNQKLPEEDSKSKTDDFEVYVGGPAANAAIVFAQLGGEATLVSCIGDSEMGKALKGMLQRHGVTVIDAINAESMTPNISSVIVNKLNGHRTIISGQKSYNDIEYEIDNSVFSGLDFILYDCNTPKLFESNIQHAKNHNLVLDAGSYKTHVPKALKVANEVISSAKFKVNNKDIIEIQDEYNIDFVAISNGGKPIKCKKINSNMKTIYPVQIDNVVDTLGAGDVLHGAYCFYRFQEKMPYFEALENASNCASNSVKHRGVIEPK